MTVSHILRQGKIKSYKFLGLLKLESIALLEHPKNKSMNTIEQHVINFNAGVTSENRILHKNIHIKAVERKIQ